MEPFSVEERVITCERERERERESVMDSCTYFVIVITADINF